MSWSFWASKNQKLNVAVEPNAGLFLPELLLFYGYHDFKLKADKVGWVDSVETRLIKDYEVEEGGYYTLQVANDFAQPSSGPYSKWNCPVFFRR